jgi:hypothetical protein
MGHLISHRAHRVRRENAKKLCDLCGKKFIANLSSKLKSLPRRNEGEESGGCICFRIPGFAGQARVASTQRICFIFSSAIFASRAQRAVNVHLPTRIAEALKD